jgi:glyoxylase-like metal-dependent hydrolase (beta-lactamase superfamily II)
MVLVETPLNDARSQAVIDQVKSLVPGKPIRFVVNSHAHFDHSGGVRTAVAEGATIVTQAANVAYFEGVMAQANRIQPDRMAQSGKRVNLMAVNDKLAMGDPSRPIELHRMTESGHSDSFLMIYLPNEKLLIEADAFTPGAPGTPPPAVPNANNLNLIANIERLRLDVVRILPLHGRVVAAAELYTTAGKVAPAR